MHDAFRPDDGEATERGSATVIHRASAPERRPEISFAPGLIVLAHGIFNLLLNPTASSAHHYLEVAVVGVMLIQPVLFGIWMSLSERPFVLRFLAGVAACLFGALMEFWGRHKLNQNEFNFAILVVAFYTLTTVLLLPVRHFLGYRIYRTGARQAAGPYARRQFGIQHLLACTFLVAVLIGVLRIALSRSATAGNATRELLQMGIFFAIFVPPIVVPWATLSYRPDRKRSTLAALALCFLASGIGIAVMATMPRGWVPGDSVLFLGAAQAGAVMAGFTSALTLRLCGYRIISPA